MAIFKCKMCGGSLEASGESSVVTCEYCGSVQTLPKKNDEIITNLFNRANNLRIKCEFDKAAEVYEKILNEDNADSEAHWGLVLCKYGIEYVEDPKTYKRIPTCHRTQYEAVLSDVDYIAAIKNADPVSAGIYKAQAEQIANLQKDILAIVSNEKPFDVFICYKQTDENGKRTVDSALANDIYYQLTQEGFKVFYSAITLEDKLGYEYEPYIFAALNSAKVMLVVGTKPEYFDAIWVRNEWSRYLKLMKADRSKLIIPCYRDMDAYDLPEEFSHLQAQDMAKIGFVNDVVRGIKKVLKAEAPAAETVVKETVISSGNANTAALLKRAFMFLEDGDFNSANEYCEKVLDNDPECAEAYLAKLMAEGSFRKREDLRNAANPFNGNANYVKAVRFGDDALKEELDGYIEFINQRKIREELSRRYCFAHSKMREAKTVDQYREAKRLFVLLGDYKDSAAKAQECENLALQKEEAKYEETLGLEKTALEYLNGATIRAVLENYKKLDGYRDCRERETAFKHKVVARCDELINEGRYGKVSSLSGVISGFEGGADRVRIAKEKLEEQTKKERAKLKKVVIISFSAVAALIVGLLIYCFAIKPALAYKKAEGYLESGNKAAAALAFGELNGYKDAEERSSALWKEITGRKNLSAGGHHTVTLKTDGKVVAVGHNKYGQCNVDGWSDIVAVSAGNLFTIGLKSDGTVVAVGDNEYGQCDVAAWKDIVSVAAGFRHTVGLKSDGTVVAVGSNGSGQCDVSSWSDIVAVSAGSGHTVGLKSDGTVVAAGDSTGEWYHVSGWSDIVAISASSGITVGLKSNGTVVAVGANSYGECNVSEWKDIVAVSAGGNHTVGIKSDGTVVSTEYLDNNEYTYDDYAGQCDVENWTDIVEVSSGKYHTVGLKSDGTFVAVGSNESGQCDVVKWLFTSKAKEDTYNSANAALDSGDKTKALSLFWRVSDYKDAKAKCIGIWNEIAEKEIISGGNFHTVGLKSDGTVVVVGSNGDNRRGVEDWNDIVAVSAGGYYTVGLKSDGTVVAIGDNKHGQCDVSDWRDIVAVSAGGYHTVGLKSDGTVVAIGDNRHGQCDVSDWRDIVAISAGACYTIGLKSDGTVVAVGDAGDGQLDVSDWRDIVAVSAGSVHTVGLKSDGTVVAIGDNENGQCNVEDWADIVAVSAGSRHTVGLKSDGTVVAVGNTLQKQCDVSEWKDIVAVSAGENHTVGLKSDGTVVAVGHNEYGQRDVYDWRNIKLP